MTELRPGCSQTTGHQLSSAGRFEVGAETCALSCLDDEHRAVALGNTCSATLPIKSRPSPLRPLRPHHDQVAAHFFGCLDDPFGGVSSSKQALDGVLEVRTLDALAHFLQGFTIDAAGQPPPLASRP